MLVLRIVDPPASIKTSRLATLTSVAVPLLEIPSVEPGSLKKVQIPSA